jgi:hypothetical protein
MSRLAQRPVQDALFELSRRVALGRSERKRGDDLLVAAQLSLATGALAQMRFNLPGFQRFEGAEGIRRD